MNRRLFLKSVAALFGCGWLITTTTKATKKDDKWVTEKVNHVLTAMPWHSREKVTAFVLQHREAIEKGQWLDI